MKDLKFKLKFILYAWPLLLLGSASALLSSCNGMANLKWDSDSRFLKTVLTVKWRNNVDPDWEYNPLTWQLFPEENSAPRAEEGREIVCTGSTRKFVTCYSTETGAIIWSKELSGRILASPTFYNDRLFVGTTAGQFYAFSIKTGKLLWKYQTDGEILSPAAVFTPEEEKKPALVLFTTTLNQIVALRAEDGKWEWQYKHDPPAELTIRGQAPPVIEEDTVYCGFSDGSLVAFKVGDGKVLWKKKLVKDEEFPDIDEPVVIGDGYLLVAPYNAPLMALDPASGEIKWKSKIRRSRRPVLVDGELFTTTSDGAVASIELDTGKTLWKKKIPKAGALTPAIADDYRLYFGSSEGSLYVVSRDDGRILQTIRFGSSFAQPTIADNTLFALSYNGFLYAFDMNLDED